MHLVGLRAWSELAVHLHWCSEALWNFMRLPLPGLDWCQAQRSTGLRLQKASIPLSASLCQAAADHIRAYAHTNLSTLEADTQSSATLKLERVVLGLDSVAHTAEHMSEVVPTHRCLDTEHVIVTSAIHEIQNRKWVASHSDVFRSQIFKLLCLLQIALWLTICSRLGLLLQC